MPSRWSPFLWLRNIGILVPSLLVVEDLNRLIVLGIELQGRPPPELALARWRPRNGKWSPGTVNEVNA